jgi:hypothetical protein
MQIVYIKGVMSGIIKHLHHYAYLGEFLLVGLDGLWEGRAGVSAVELVRLRVEIVRLLLRRRTCRIV